MYIKSFHDRNFLKTTKNIRMHLSRDYYIPTRVHSTEFDDRLFRITNAVKANGLFIKIICLEQRDGKIFLLQI